MTSLPGGLERPEEPDEPVDPREREFPEDATSTPEDYTVPDVDPEETIAGPVEDDEEPYAHPEDDGEPDEGEGTV